MPPLTRERVEELLSAGSHLEESDYTVDSIDFDAPLQGAVYGKEVADRPNIKPLTWGEFRQLGMAYLEKYKG